MSRMRRQAEDLPQTRLLSKSKRRLRTSEACLRIPLIKKHTNKKAESKGGGWG